MVREGAVGGAHPTKTGMASALRFAWLVAASIFSALATTIATGAADSPTIRPLPSSAPVQKALGQGKYPWYDAASDTVKPLWPPRLWDLDWLDRWLKGNNLGWLPSAGNLIAMGLAGAALLILLGVLFALWRRSLPAADFLGTGTRQPGSAARTEGLPEGLRTESDDPWAEAVRCRARGDYARAVVCLFAHQLLTLDRLRQVRLVPGRTGRQLVRAITDRQLRNWVDPTLRLFEAVYYGQRTPSADAFEPVWAAAEAFERRIAGGAAR